MQLAEMYCFLNKVVIVYHVPIIALEFFELKKLVT